MRAKNITPSLTRLQPMGRAKKGKDLMVTSKALYELYGDLAAIDRQLGQAWEPSIPWVHGMACKRHSIGAFVDSCGKVQPCSGVPVEAGNIKEHDLSEILSNTEIFKVARNMEKYIQGECKTCQFNNRCYGCRSLAYTMTNSFVAADPLCWNNRDAV
jgi:radical SAM protein with 4Fe4S-binding SPASM domain